MTALLTQCPHCQTSFRVSTAQMNAAHGLVRCGSCLGVFSASANEIRIRTPDGYVVEEIDPDDNSEPSFSEESEDLPTEAEVMHEDDFYHQEEAAEELPGNELADFATAKADPTDIEADTFQRDIVWAAGIGQSDNEPSEIEPIEAANTDSETSREYAEEYFARPTEEENGKNDELFVLVPATVAPQPSAADDEPLFEIAAARPQVFSTLPANEEFGEEDHEAEPDSDRSDGADDEIHDHASDEPAPWHDEPVVTLGDMRLDELEDDSQDESEDDSQDESGRDVREDLHNTAIDTDYGKQESVEEYQDEFEEEYVNETAHFTQAHDIRNHHSKSDAALTASARLHSSAAETISAAPEKRNLHQHLSALADDEFDPVDDDQLDTLDTLPVTINQGSTLRKEIAHSLLLLLSLLLIFALPLPWLYANRDVLATHPRFAFMAPLACKLFTCTPAATLDMSSIYSQQLLVRSHPRYQDALEVSFIFKNDATLPRPFPQVELAFSDFSNNLIANRLFKPQEYLPAELRQLSEMPAQSTVQVTLELKDPGKEAVNYTVKLHPPIP